MKTKHINNILASFKAEEPVSSTPHQSAYDICNNCNIYMLHDNEIGSLICSQCGLTTQVIYPTNDTVFRNDNISVVNKGLYKREIHFHEIICQFQAKQNTTIPEGLLKDIKIELSSNNHEINYENVKSILRRKKLKKYYDHIYFIIEKLGGVVPYLTLEVEGRLKNLFKALLNVWCLVAPKNRNNFLNYNFVLYHLLKLIKQDKWLSYIPLLKNEKVYQEQLDLFNRMLALIDYK